MLSKEKIRESFSKAAYTYDEASDFQRDIGRKLIERILSDGRNFKKALDIGLGTGSITQELAERFEKIYGCDIAWGMVSFSKANTKDIFITQADAEILPYKEAVFDIVFSNLTYQWIHNFRQAFSEIKRVLKNKGRFYFSILVEDTLTELYRTLKDVVKKDYAADFLPNPKYIKLELKWHGLDIAWWEEVTLKRYYENSLELVKRLKKIGAGRMTESNLFRMGQRALFFKILDEYNRNFIEDGKVFATYKVILGYAEKT